MKKNIIIIVLSVLLMISLGFNIFGNKTKNNDIDLEKDNKNLIGIYQTTYYNNYDHQMNLTIRIKDNKKLSIADYAAEYGGDGTEYRYTRKDNILNIYEDKDGDYYSLQYTNSINNKEVILSNKISTEEECNKQLDNYKEVYNTDLKCVKKNYQETVVNTIEILNDNTIFYKNKRLYKVN